MSPVTSSKRCMSVDFNAINEHEIKELHVCHVAHHASVETHMDITGPYPGHSFPLSFQNSTT